MSNSIPSMKDFKMDYRLSPSTSSQVLDIFNSYETDNLTVIKNKILVRLGTIKGEWADNPDFGIPLTSLKSNDANVDVITQIIAEEILKVQNVLNVQLISRNLDDATRLFDVSYVVNTVYGQTQVETTI